MKWLNDYRMRLVLIGFVAAMVFSVGSAKADFTFGEPTNLGPIVNSEGPEVAPSISVDGLELYWHSRGREADTSALGDIWCTTRATTADAWGTPVNLGSTVNSSSADFNPSISADRLELYFSSDRPGGSGSQDIYVATRMTRENKWDEAVNLGSMINYATNDGGPCISADGLELYFQSYNRAGGYGHVDNWIATRTTRDETWGVPVPFPPPLNTSYRDATPNISDDGLALFFDSERPGGEGKSDIWMAIRSTKDEPWGTPFNLGPTVNTSFSEGSPNFWADGLQLYFSSNDRPGGVGWHDIWQVSIEPVVDLNSDGIVDAADMCIIVDYWGTDEPLCDVGPMPWGDGVVDVEDLKVLAEHLLPVFLAHWELDETGGSIACDSVGGHDGMLNGNPLWQPAGGKVNGALQLDGVDDCIVTDSVLNPADGTFSIFAWIKGGGPGQVIVSQTNGIGWGGSWLCADASNGRLATVLMDPQPALVSESVITDGAWHHIGLVWDKSYRYLYVDGAEVARDAVSISYPMPCDGGLYLGASKTLDSGSFFSGLIDDVRIYNKALSAEEIAALAQ